MVELLKDILMWVFTVAFIGGLLFLLYMIVRLSIIAPILTRGSKKRLRKPDLNGVEKLVGFCPSASLVDFYKNWPFLEKTEYYLVDKTRSANWFIGGFMPLAKIDIKEWLNVAGKHGLPIAENSDKGTYFIQRDGSIELWSPNVSGGHSVVAHSIEELMLFKVAEWEEIDPDEEA